MFIDRLLPRLEKLAYRHVGEIDPSRSRHSELQIGRAILETKCIDVTCNACWRLLTSIIGYR